MNVSGSVPANAVERPLDERVEAKGENAKTRANKRNVTAKGDVAKAKGLMGGTT
jgi:hypothetical protein